MARTKRIPAHDSLVRNVFSRRKAFAVLLRRMLHPGLLRYVDFRSLRPGPTVHSDDELDTRTSDLYFIVDLVYRGRRYPLLLPVEHRSTPAPRMPWRAHVYLGDHWRRYIKDHPGPPYTLPFVFLILLVQYPARNTPSRLTSILPMPPKLRRLLGTPVELALAVDDFSGSVLEDTAADPATLALVELTRAFLYAYENPRSLTKRRMAVLAKQLDILLAHKSPGSDEDFCGPDDVHALCRYVIEVFEDGSPLRVMLQEAVSQPVREVYMTIEESLLAKGERRGIAKGERRGIAKGEKKGEKKGKKQGIAKGRASAVLDLLELRALPIPAPVRKRVLATRNEPLLRRWLARALTVPSADALFEPLEA